MKKNGFANSMYICMISEMPRLLIEFEYYSHIIRYANEIHQVYEVPML